jgi:hypothetical protein
MANMVALLSFVFVYRAFSSDVITRAIAPIGCTTISGANESAPSCNSIPKNIKEVPETQRGLISSFDSSFSDNETFG